MLIPIQGFLHIGAIFFKDLFVIYQNRFEHNVHTNNIVYFYIILQYTMHLTSLYKNVVE